MLKLIKTEEQYRTSLKRLGEVFNAPVGSPESDEADVLALLVGAYEDEYYPIGEPDPIETIKIRMEEMQLKQIDLAEAVGGKSRVSEILNKKRKLTVDMIRNLSVLLHVSVSSLIGDYQLER
ncbi:type II toxin-antitoxin system HigA family antitoxin [Dyadobacter sp. Leaf189]|uniref:helix-turn-helix domain-containing protein n=1 Tax=Dyadobacter sp. Leaf189 TaxID=1736295 RepID=UPI0006FE51B5|nr:helix-turn-helix domain-containing protein [Dyadobacter sp. Leaf189]KQS31044.1 DNA-binding protein [Dyadobacter sp. Leaf189]